MQTIDHTLIQVRSIGIFRMVTWEEECLSRYKSFASLFNPYITTRKIWQKQKDNNKELDTTRTHLLRGELLRDDVENDTINPAWSYFPSSRAVSPGSRGT